MIKLGAECFAAILFVVVLAIMYFYMVGKRNEETAEESRKKVISDLTSMTKDDYDFMVRNDVEMPQEVHDHFNPKPKAIEYDPVLDAVRVPVGELEYADRFGGTFGESKRRIRKGERQKQVAGDNVYDPSMLQWKSWIETEKIRG